MGTPAMTDLSFELPPVPTCFGISSLFTPPPTHTHNREPYDTLLSDTMAL